MSLFSELMSVVGPGRMLAEHLVGGGHAADGGDPVPSISSSVRPGIELGSSTTVPPLRSVGSTPMSSEATWNIGEIISATSVEAKSKSTMHVDAVPRDVPVGQQRALGMPGGSGGVEDHGAVVQGHRFVRRAAAAPEATRPQSPPPPSASAAGSVPRRAGRAAGIVDGDAPATARARGSRVPPGREAPRRGPAGTRAAVLQLELDFRRREPGVERDEDGAQAGRRRRGSPGRTGWFSPEVGHPVALGHPAVPAGRWPAGRLRSASCS